MDRPAEPRRRFGMTWALVISAILHVVLIVVSIWMPVAQVPVAARSDDSVLRFTFAQPAAEQADARPAGDVPFETPPSRPGTPLPPTEEPNRQPAEPDFEPEGRPSLEAPSSAAADQPETVVEPPDPPSPLQPDPTPDDADASDDLRSEFAEDAAGTLQAGADELSTPERVDRPTSSLNVDKRLREFGQALDRARAAQAGRQQAPRAPRNVFTPEPSAFPATGFGAGNLVFESRDYDWTDYARQIYTAIWRAWHQRLYLTTDEFEKWAYQNEIWLLEHYSRIGFVIERSGQVTGIVLEGPSGCVPLDDSALDALSEVILPPLPGDFPRDSETVHATFIAVGQINSMRPILNQLKRLGYF